MNRAERTPAVKVVGLHKDFGDYPILRGLNLTVEWGRLLVIFGPNGSGKTTLLKLLATQYRPDRGKIWIGGISCSQDPVAVRRIIGVVAHQPMLYQDMTCQENLTFFGRMHGLADITRRIDDVLHQVGLELRRHQRVRSLSHGMQKRLAIGRATLHDPAILLMDEPESGLDQEALDSMGNLLCMGTGSNRTVIITTHNVDRGLAWGHEIAILSDGVITYRANRESLDVRRFKSTYLKQIEVGL